MITATSHGPATGDTRTASTQSPHLSLGCTLLVASSVLVLAAAVRHGADDSGAAIGAIPALASLAIVASVVRWRPTFEHLPVRSVSVRWHHTIVAMAAVVAVVCMIGSRWAQWAIGPAFTVAVCATYLSTWGFRRLFLLRRVVAMSVLTWYPVAQVLEPLCRATIAVPSNIIYRRLASIGAYGIDQHPWRLYGAMSHRGWITVAGVVLLGVMSTREPMTSRRVGVVLIAAYVGLVVHHAVVLAMPIEQYGHDLATELIVSAWFEITIAALIGTCLGGIGSRYEPDGAVQINHADRDPMIFAAGHAEVTVALRLATIAVPLTALAVAVAR
ncbi:MAG: hypothetical protein AB7V43_09140 [Acidimicrobiia bacterium]